MKKILFILLVLFTINLSAQDQVQVIRMDSIQIYTPMPEPKLVETVVSAPFLKRSLNRLSKKYKVDTFVVKVYYSDGTAQTTILRKKREDE